MAQLWINDCFFSGVIAELAEHSLKGERRAVREMVASFAYLLSFRYAYWPYLTLKLDP